MSFLNPVNEPVLRFKSTDAGAPQINYNARVAGDVKAVLKACLVTGYGDKASAGWTAENEVNNVIEFVSPSTAMSDYRLGIDDTSTSSTTWYYHYQDARTNPSYNTPTKSFSNVDKSHADNGWQLLVTERGIVFVELVQHSAVSKLSARITYYGMAKSTLNNSDGRNIVFFNIGHSAAISQNNSFFTGSPHAFVGGIAASKIASITASVLSELTYSAQADAAEVSGDIYLISDVSKALVAKLPALLSKATNNQDNMYGVSEYELEGRSVISVCAGYATTSAAAYDRARSFVVFTDYWEY